MLNQGDIIKVENIKVPIFVASKDFFNRTNEIIGCPIYNTGTEGPLHIKVSGRKRKGIVQCEKLALLDLNARGYSVLDRCSISDSMNVTDTIQGIFDYI
ncbi:MAG: type II toxin-antitoxin system PemK/MazF family toxin [Eubacterium sp.]|nr:type II toxin-antitoxin system PemK/MazF family toxin [Eubacterium sp.]